MHTTHRFRQIERVEALRKKGRRKAEEEHPQWTVAAAPRYWNVIIAPVITQPVPWYKVYFSTMDSASAGLQNGTRSMKKEAPPSGEFY